jgi:hypothetical protein
MIGGCVGGCDLLYVGIVILNVGATHVFLHLLVKFIGGTLLFTIVLVVRVVNAV